MCKIAHPQSLIGAPFLHTLWRSLLGNCPYSSPLSNLVRSRIVKNANY
jgi:hypothetical protein